MKRHLALVAIALLGALGITDAARAEGAAIDRVREAVDALGGAEALRALKGIAIKAEGKHWEPEQSLVPDGEPRLTDEFAYATTWDLAQGMARTDWDRIMKYPAATHEVYSEIVTPTLGYVADAKGQRGMSGVRLAAHLRELERASPALLLKALDHPERLRDLPEQMIDGAPHPAVAFEDDGTSFIILLDRGSHLPLAIRTLDDDNIHGDSTYDLVLADWQPVAGVQVARSLTFKLNGGDIARIAVKEVTANPAIAADTFAVPDAARAAAKPPAKTDVPYQWVLRRLNLYRFTDSDAINYDAAANPGGLKLVELAPHVQQVVGGSHNNLIVAMKDYLVVFDAPINEWQSRWVIDAAKAKYPGKPIKYLVLTHHHMDHTGGARTYVAEGATVIVPAPDKAHFEKDFAAQRTVSPDTLAKHPRQAEIIEVAEKLELKEGDDEIRLFNVENPHVKGMLIAYDAKADLMWVTDLWSPGRDKQKTPNNTAFAETLKQLGISPARFAGGHGSTGTREELAEIVAQK